MYLLQKSLFSFESWLEIESSERLELFFSALDLQLYAVKLESSSPQGSKPINREAILRALLAAPLEGISTFTRLHERLVNDLRFRYQCGFRLDKRVPSISTLSRVFATITEKGLAKTLFVDLVSQCREAGIIDGTHLAIDSTAISAYERKQPKLRSQETGNANWGAKYDTFGNQLTWFGYKIHLAVDTASELPVSLEVTPAHVYDGEIAIPLMKDIAENLGWKFKFVMMDAGYDQVKNYQAARDYRAQAIIALNKRRETEPPSGMSSNGTPRCSMGFDMVYWGADGDRLKFRCPHVLGKVDCPLGTTACSDSNYGMVLKRNITEDVRRYSNPHRNTRRWTELYNERTAVERCNSRLKVHLTANDAHVSGIEKVTTHVYLNTIVLLASALATQSLVRGEEIA
ncbi:transposase [Alicyclobacillus acidoterrestris]|uniref:Transposase n=3 Tax=Alicyclobacillus TaxID=29330 RepID=T0C8B6_ALIAG|nr:transposase [Alicyclobacillus acidoterrestris]EPZ49179.1 transposase IS4 [Alicyclobacillus acidoterrestris ATCC 49025]UNO49416.1 transposase [Alicyclobacillus acidoterrestris]